MHQDSLILNSSGIPPIQISREQLQIKTSLFVRYWLGLLHSNK
jgi:hypothetical protein